MLCHIYINMNISIQEHNFNIQKQNRIIIVSSYNKLNLYGFLIQLPIINFNQIQHLFFLTFDNQSNFVCLYISIYMILSFKDLLTSFQVDRPRSILGLYIWNPFQILSLPNINQDLLELKGKLKKQSRHLVFKESKNSKIYNGSKDLSKWLVILKRRYTSLLLHLFK